MKMAEVTARERDLELELDLGLSIGVSFRRLKEEKTISISKEDGCCTDNESLAMDSKQRKRGRSFGPESEEERKRELKKEKYGVMKNNHRKNLDTMPLVNGYWTNCTEEKIVNRNVSSLNGGNLEQSCCSSLVSDNYQTSSSNEGGSSNSYTKSNSSSDQYQMMSSHVSRISPTRNLGIKEELGISSKHEVPLSKSISNTVKSNPMKPKNIKMENGKPPKPQTQACHIPSLRQMPRVSTTGTGRNGKTIVGILYRYSKAEVSILCACHGESFSPAEFVKHAGGVEVLHPLRHITVLPTDSGIPSTFR